MNHSSNNNNNKKNENNKKQFLNCYFSSTPQKNDFNNKCDDANSNNNALVSYMNALNDSIQILDDDHISTIDSYEEIQMEISYKEEEINDEFSLSSEINSFEMNITANLSISEPLYSNF